ncbi:SIS domain-containing protein (plasmid) [Lactobacillus curvatus]|nr:SIS domain-containing protein [Latilactobacillus curvatus]MSD84812.1 SIS domain-containing protein [Latilactobacillus curvatus]MSE22862.1 SIS domain-containing protein [Latilactobacillus curvatus]MSE24956.1 SIS domain-containing protein [Latilactobacillus curvatus]
MIITKLSDHSHFSERELFISEYILENGNNVCHMTIQELAKVTYSSPSTIMRLCKKISTTGFSDFKIQLSRELANQELLSTQSNYNFPFHKGDSYKTVIDNIYYVYRNSINEVQSEFDVNQLYKIVETIHTSTYLDIYGQGSSQASAFEFKSKMIRLGANVHLESCYTEQLHQAVNSNNTHVALVISHSGENPETLKIARTLKKTNTPIISITKDKNTMLAKLSAFSIYTGINEAKLLKNKIETFSSSIATKYILDCLYSFIYLRQFDLNLKKTKKNEIELRKRFFE